jgi:hypothetical protein
VTNPQAPTPNPPGGSTKPIAPPKIWWTQLERWLEGRPPSPGLRSDNTVFFRTQAAFFSTLLVMSLVMLIVFLPFALYHTYPTLIDIGSMINLYVAIGTGLLGAAALATLYFQTVDRTADRAPNLELKARFMDHTGRYVPMNQGEFHTLDSTLIETEITNVGPGVARDIWYFAVPPPAEPVSDANDAIDPTLLRRIPLRRFIRVGDGLTLPSKVMGMGPNARMVGGKDHRFVLVVGCDDLDGKLGDVEIIAFETDDSPAVVALLSPTEAEAALWDLTKGYSRRWWRRMGFFLPAEGLRAERARKGGP